MVAAAVAAAAEEVQAAAAGSGAHGVPCHRDDPSAYYDDFNSSMAVINSIATRFPLHGGDELQKQGWNNIVREFLAGDRFGRGCGASTTSRST